MWVLAETQGGRAGRVGFELLTRAAPLAEKLSVAVTALVIGKIEAADVKRLIACGADRVVVVEGEGLERFLVEPYASAVAKAIAKYRPEVVLAGATSTGRTLMPYVAAKIDAGLTADCTELDIEEGTGLLLQTRPAIGGNILATIKTPRHRPQMATVRPHSTRAAEPEEGREGEVVRMKLAAGETRSRVKFAGFEAMGQDSNLQSAERIVSVGRGIKKPENIALAEKLAEKLGAALGATRDVVDRGWLSYPHQVGLSGKTVTPKLYVAVGLSGSIQHLAGMQTAETIIAINSDPDAQIFKVADVAIVGDLFEVVPELIRRLESGEGVS